MCFQYKWVCFGGGDTILKPVALRHTHPTHAADDKTIRVWEWDIPFAVKYMADPTMSAMPTCTVHPSGNQTGFQGIGRPSWGGGCLPACLTPSRVFDIRHFPTKDTHTPRAKHTFLAPRLLYGA